MLSLHIFVDLFAIPTLLLGINRGLIMHLQRETAFFYDPESTSFAEKQWIGVVVSHELVHQVNTH